MDKDAIDKIGKAIKDSNNSKIVHCSKYQLEKVFIFRSKAREEFKYYGKVCVKNDQRPVTTAPKEIFCTKIYLMRLFCEFSVVYSQSLPILLTLWLHHCSRVGWLLLQQKL